ncbi:MAG TPA: LacI family DNA-binding transcriptional regulator [Treponemataceae bacterium]|nr:LacI family DNA-binding transcriptional regulator [Treponemataceae bacterium]
MAISIRDIAKKGNVSAATVSLVLNDAPGVSEKTRQRIKDIISELNYVPNARARSFSVGRAGVIALITPPWKAAFSDPYYTEMIRGALEAVRDKDHQLMLEICDSRFNEHRLWKKLFESKKIDGMLIATPYLDQDYVEELHQSGYPTLLINGERPDLPKMHSISYDDYRCGQEATNHLLQLGHIRIAHICGPANQSSALHRKKGYKDALTKAGLPVIAEYIEDGNYMPLEAKKALIKILALPEGKRPTAFFCANDTMAASVITHLQELGYRIPQDFSVIGVDDNIISQSTEPKITTFRQDIFDISHKGTNLFLESLIEKGETIPQVIRIPMELITRSSCARCKN